MRAPKNDDGTTLTKHKDIERRCEQFYTDLFASKFDVPLEYDRRVEESVPPVIISEVRAAAESLKNDKAPGTDGITDEMLKAGGPTF